MFSSSLSHRLLINVPRDLLKDVLKLQKVLIPTSSLHQDQNKEKKLRKYVAEVQELSSRFPECTAKEWGWDLAVAVKSIVQERMLWGKQLKPCLVVEDDLCF